MRSQTCYDFANVNPLFPVLGSHFFDQALEPGRSAFRELQNCVLGLDVYFQFRLAHEGEELGVESIDTDTQRPDVGGFAAVAVRSGELLLRASKPGSPRREIRDVIFGAAGSCEIRNLDVCPFLLTGHAQDVVHLDVSVCDVVVVKKL